MISTFGEEGGSCVDERKKARGEEDFPQRGSDGKGH